MKEPAIRKGYEYAKERYAECGVDTDAAIARANAVPVSMHCWQGDDVIGFDGATSLSGGISATGSYPGKARTPEELRGDMLTARSLAPGAVKLNLHACYAEKTEKSGDRDAYTFAEFERWCDWAVRNGMGIDFNPTYFSHPMMDRDFSLSSFRPEVRRFWVEHGKRCREIGLEFARRTGKPCVVNYWMPDGYKDACADTASRRALMASSLDEILSGTVSDALVPCALESKLFGVGLESYTVVSHEFALGYAQSRSILPCLDAGHFHPTEVISAKISAVLAFNKRLLLHVSRGVRWDSDHVVTLDDELQRIMDEILWNGFEDRVFISLDYFDASINRIACWAIGLRNTRKALLSAALAPSAAIRAAERDGDLTARLALMEERKTLPLGAVWDYACLSGGIPSDYISEIRSYEHNVLSGR